jgi:hypothetical protein
VSVTIARESEEVRLMKGRRHTPEQVVRKQREADRLLAEGPTSMPSAGNWRLGADLPALAVAVQGDAAGGRAALEGDWRRRTRG